MEGRTIEQSGSLKTAAASPAYTLGELTRYALGLGTWGFGGPVALIGYMHRDLVERRKWISEAEYKEGCRSGGDCRRCRGPRPAHFAGRWVAAGDRQGGAVRSHIGRAYSVQDAAGTCRGAGSSGHRLGSVSVVFEVDRWHEKHGLDCAGLQDFPWAYGGTFVNSSIGICLTSAGRLRKRGLRADHPCRIPRISTVFSERHQMTPFFFENRQGIALAPQKPSLPARMGGVRLRPFGLRNVARGISISFQGGIDLR
jgi:hypothetical protein